MAHYHWYFVKCLIWRMSSFQIDLFSLYYFNFTEIIYNETSNKGPSEKGTTSLQGTLPISPEVYMQYISTSEKRIASFTRDKMTGLKVFFTRGFNVHVLLFVSCQMWTVLFIEKARKAAELQARIKSQLAAKPNLLATMKDKIPTL